MTGFRPIITARQGRMLGSRNPLDGPVFDRLQDAFDYSIDIQMGAANEGVGTASETSSADSKRK